MTTLTSNVTTLTELREFLALCDVLHLTGDATLVARTRFNGQLRQLTIDSTSSSTISSSTTEVGAE